MKSFSEKINRAWSESSSLICVGLDPDISRFPPHLRRETHPIYAFNRAIIEATGDLVCAYKPQIAYYAAQGAENELEMTIGFIREACPHAIVILDAKRADIGATAEMYAREAFLRYGADAVTVNPYMGGDTLKPFLDFPDRGTFVLCRTSNPGSGDLQNLTSQGRPIYRIVADLAAGKWNRNRNIGLVVGATCPEAIGELRAATGDMPFLVPGIGAQGGDPRRVVQLGKTPSGTGLIINSSRAIIYAGAAKDFAAAARKAAKKLLDSVNRYR